MKPRYVFDSWALLAFLQREEPAASRVKQLLEQGEAGEVDLFLSIINLGEVFYRVGKAKGGGAAREVLAEIRRLALTTVSASDDIVFSAAEWKMLHPLSYADAFAVVTAIDAGATLVTGDPEITRLAGRVSIETLTRLQRR